MNRQIDEGMDGQTDGRIDRRTDGWMDGRTDGQTDGRGDGWMDGQTDRPTADRCMDKQQGTDRWSWTDRQTERQHLDSRLCSLASLFSSRAILKRFFFPFFAGARESQRLSSPIGSTSPRELDCDREVFLCGDWASELNDSEAGRCWPIGSDV